MSNTNKHIGNVEWDYNPFDQPTHEWVQHPEYPAVGRFKETENVWNHVEYKE